MDCIHTKVMGPYSSVGKSTSLALRRLLVCKQQGGSFILHPLNNREMLVLSTSLKKFLLEENLYDSFKKIRKINELNEYQGHVG